ncbi:LysR family transcriptional regulator [Nakamurella endophytica]|uniref:LysR family transcriptional regulator n=1 Tax=Nakamurella endophytica TaxID=1748367 RepID=A0A917SPY5_9ACTN|nr:LysR family transcriptional regulator [Nakamurella endophytica]GGL92178.1 LysR family transcriptional regulator [Nakamurella endophytica]
MLDLQRLRVLRAVVADGSIHGAAASLGYSASAISQQISALQRATGLVLIERNGRGIAPTAAARRLTDEAGRVFQSLAELDGLVEDLRAGRTGTLTVSYFASAGATWIPPAIATVVREFPRLRLDLRLVERAETHEADVEIFVEGPTPPESRPGYRVRPLVEEPYHVVVRRDSAFGGHRHVALRDLADQAWIDNDVAHGPCRQLMLDACQAAGFTPAFRVETQDYASAIQFVAQGLGITVVPRLGLGALPVTVVAIPVTDPVPVRRISLAVRAGSAANPAASRLVELLTAQARTGDL